MHFFNFLNSFPTTGCNKFYTSSNRGTIYSPMYPNLYPNNTACAYNITGEKGSMIFLSIRVPYLYNGDTLQVYEREPQSGRITRRKNFDRNDAYYSMSNSLLIKFNSNGVETNSGFKIDFFVTKGTYSCLGQSYSLTRFKISSR